MQPMKRLSYIYVALLTMFTMIFAAAPAMAETKSLGNDGKPVCIALPILSGAAAGGCPAGTYLIDNSPENGGAIVSYLKLFLKLFNMLVGVVVVLVLVIAGFQYITSAGDPSNTKQAKGRITAALTALILYMLMVAILNFLLPGGAL